MSTKLTVVGALFVLTVASLGAQIADLRLAGDETGWLTYSGSYRSERFSPLTQISRENVKRLRPVWLYQPPGTGALEVTPVVADGVMYVTAGAPATVVALDLKSGRPLWEWSRPIPDTVHNLGFPRVNRGVAILDGTV